MRGAPFTHKAIRITKWSGWATVVLEAPRNLLFGEPASLPPMHNRDRETRAHPSRNAKDDYVGLKFLGSALCNRPFSVASVGRAR